MLRINTDDLLNAFYTVTGINVSVLDRDFHTLSMIRKPAAPLCTEIHRDPKTVDVCKASDVEHLSAVKRKLSPLLYTCPFGLTEAIVPILRDDTPIGYLIASLGVERGKELDAAKHLPHRSTEGASEEPLKTHSREELEAVFRLLQTLADYLSEDESLGGGERSIGVLTKRYIKNNLAQKLTLRDIAKSLHCSTVTLTEHFRTEFGITINEYITKKRMELSEKLLLTTETPLREIASSCGFSDVEYFSRTFKRYHGESPARWRRSQTKDAE